MQTLSESFGDGSLLIYSHLYTLPEGETIEPYLSDKIEARGWSKANIRVGSQGTSKRRASVQRLVIDTLLSDSDPYDVIFDDDGKGEIAAVMALRISDSVVSVSLYHCKYSGADTPGARFKASPISNIS